MAIFSDLPVEMLRNVIMFIGSIKDLSQLCLTTKSLRQLAEPLLYQRFDESDSRFDHSYSVRCLIHTLLLRPELRYHVKEIKLKSWESAASPGHGTEEWKPDVPRTDDKELFVEGIRKLNVPDEDFVNEWISQFSRSIEDAEIALLLSYLPNIEILRFQEPYRPNITWKMLSLASSSDLADSNINRFQRLRTIYAVGPDAKYGYLTFNDLEFVFRLPSVQEFNGGFINSSELSWDAKPRTSGVTSISFINSLFAPGNIKPILDRCERLESFRYTCNAFPFGPDRHTPRDLAIALEPHQSTLQHLDVDYYEDWDHFWGDLPDTRLYFGSLSQFSALKYLRCGEQALLGLLHKEPEGKFLDTLPPLTVNSPPRLADVLPPNLEELTIHTCDTRVIQHLSELKLTNFPKLHKITIVFARETVQEDQVEPDMADVIVHFEYQGPNERERQLGIEVEDWGYQVYL